MPSSGLFQVTICLVIENLQNIFIWNNINYDKNYQEVVVYQNMHLVLYVLKPFNFEHISKHCMVIQFTIPSHTKASLFYSTQRYKDCPGGANLALKHVNLIPLQKIRNSLCGLQDNINRIHTMVLDCSISLQLPIYINDFSSYSPEMISTIKMIPPRKS